MSRLKNLYFYLAQSAKWLARYHSRRRFNKRPIHVVFCMVDHYEPGQWRRRCCDHKIQSR